MKSKKKKEKKLFSMEVERFYLMCPLYIFVREVALKKSNYNTE